MCGKLEDFCMTHSRNEWLTIGQKKEPPSASVLGDICDPLGIPEIEDICGTAPPRLSTLLPNWERMDVGAKLKDHSRPPSGTLHLAAGPERPGSSIVGGTPKCTDCREVRVHESGDLCDVCYMRSVMKETLDNFRGEDTVYEIRKKADKELRPLHHQITPIYNYEHIMREGLLKMFMQRYPPTVPAKKQEGRNE